MLTFLSLKVYTFGDNELLLKSSQTVMDKVIKRIYGHGRGWVFTSRDFFDLGNRDSIKKSLSRLCTKGIIRRLARGIYDYPKEHPSIGLLSPDPYNIAKAIAKSRNIKIQASGTYSANILGLTEQVPSKIVFLTDGAPKTVKIGNMTIQLKLTRPGVLVGAGRLSGTIVQAIKYLGKNNMDDIAIQKIKKQLHPKDITELESYKLDLPGWMQPIIERLINDDQ